MLCIGLSYRTAPVGLRELAQFGGDRTAALLGTNGAGVRGLVVLSTCGRTELYADVGADSGAAEEHLTALLSEATGVASDRLMPHLYVYRGEAAERHLCRVAAGVDSAVPGEPEILGQVRSAHLGAELAGTSTPRLARLFQVALRCGRRARHETAINRGAAGLGAVPVELATRHLGSLENSHIVVVGRGRMARSTLAALEKQPVRRVTVVARRLEDAVPHAGRPGVIAAALDTLPRVIQDADVVITATAAARPILDRTVTERAVATRPERPLFVADLGLPRNVSPDVSTVPGVLLYDIDALKEQVGRVHRERLGERPRVEAIIDDELSRLRREEQHAVVRPTLRSLHASAERIRRATLDQAAATCTFDAATREQLDYLTRRLVTRLLRAPTRTLLEASEAGEAAPLAAGARALFDLGDCA